MPNCMSIIDGQCQVLAFIKIYLCSLQSNNLIIHPIKSNWPNMKLRNFPSSGQIVFIKNVANGWKVTKKRVQTKEWDIFVRQSNRNLTKRVQQKVAAQLVLHLAHISCCCCWKINTYILKMQKHWGINTRGDSWGRGQVDRMEKQ